MKLVTVYASADLENTVVSAIQHSGAPTYLTLDGATAHRFNRSHDLPRTMTWEATMFVVPCLNDEQAADLAASLRRDCDFDGTHPCLRVTVSDVDASW